MYGNARVCSRRGRKGRSNAKPRFEGGCGGGSFDYFSFKFRPHACRTICSFRRLKRVLLWCRSACGLALHNSLRRSTRRNSRTRKSRPGKHQSSSSCPPLLPLPCGLGCAASRVLVPAVISCRPCLPCRAWQGAADVDVFRIWLVVPPPWPDE